MSTECKIAERIQRIRRELRTLNALSIGLGVAVVLLFLGATTLPPQEEIVAREVRVVGADGLVSIAMFNSDNFPGNGSIQILNGKKTNYFFARPDTLNFATAGNKMRLALLIEDEADQAWLQLGDSQGNVNLLLSSAGPLDPKHYKGNVDDTGTLKLFARTGEVVSMTAAGYGQDHVLMVAHPIVTTGKYIRAAK